MGNLVYFLAGMTFTAIWSVWLVNELRKLTNRLRSENEDLRRDLRQVLTESYGRAGISMDESRGPLPSEWTEHTEDGERVVFSDGQIMRDGVKVEPVSTEEMPQ